MTGKPIIHALTRRKSMRSHLVLCIAAFTLVAANAAAANCTLRPKQVVTQFMTRFYVDKKVREAFETWVDPGYIQHNPMAETGRDAAINFLARIIADGNLVAVHSHGVFAPGDRGIAVVDILRVEGCKIMEHWDVVQPVPEKAANSNSMF
jgi:predicted SnoaL-like aldol condensation-catalyzing enzyme